MRIIDHRAHRRGMSLIEIIAALIIAATVAAVGIRHLRPADASSKQRSCDLTRQLLQNDVRRFQETTGQNVSANLRELENDQYSGTTLPICPGSKSDYRLNRNGQVECPNHP